MKCGLGVEVDRMIWDCGVGHLVKTGSGSKCLLYDAHKWPFVEESCESGTLGIGLIPNQLPGHQNDSREIPPSAL